MFTAEDTLAQLVANRNKIAEVPHSPETARAGWSSLCTSTVHDLRDKPTPATAQAPPVVPDTCTRSLSNTDTFPRCLAEDFFNAPKASPEVMSRRKHPSLPRDQSEIVLLRKKPRNLSKSINDTFPKEDLQVLWKAAARGKRNESRQMQSTNFEGEIPSAPAAKHQMTMDGIDFVNASGK